MPRKKKNTETQAVETKTPQNIFEIVKNREDVKHEKGGIVHEN